MFKPLETAMVVSSRLAGKIEQGVIRAGQKVEILGLGDVLESVCTSVEAFNEVLD